MCMCLKVRFLHNNSIVCAQYFANGILWGNLVVIRRKFAELRVQKKITPYGQTHNIHTVHIYIYILYVYVHIHTQILHTHIFRYTEIHRNTIWTYTSACTHAIQCNTICHPTDIHTPALHRAILGKPIFENRPKTAPLVAITTPYIVTRYCSNY